jgi:hypothetical protein
MKKMLCVKAKGIIILCILLFLIPVFSPADESERGGFTFGVESGVGVSFSGESSLFNLSGGVSCGFSIMDNLILEPLTRIAMFPLPMYALCEDTYGSEIDSFEQLCLFFIVPFLLPAFTHTLIGIGCTYYLNDAAPSFFFKLSGGFSFWMDPNIEDIALGGGVIGTVGYEFAKRQGVCLEVMYSMGKGDSENVDSQMISVMVLYTLRII